MRLLIIAALTATVVEVLMALLSPARMERKHQMEEEARKARALALLREHEAKQEREAIKQELYEKSLSKLPSSL